MLINIKKSWEVNPSEITSERNFNARRQFLKYCIYTTSAVLAGYATTSAQAKTNSSLDIIKSNIGQKYLLDDDDLTSYEAITQYNNFYEFGTGKQDPFNHAHSLKTKPWIVSVTGACENPGEYHLDDLLNEQLLEERIYRFRCVETWSMVVPWLGIPLSSILNRLAPHSNANYVSFETLHDPSQMPGQRLNTLNWPYKEGLRLDEAMHPLTLLTVGLYGKFLPNQNGAPIRLVVPWKYGFKSIKSIVKIHFQETMPITSWSQSSPKEYGFFSNVNPEINHRRWSQAKERRVGEFFKRPTLMFNGYGEEVSNLYTNLDLKKWF